MQTNNETYQGFCNICDSEIAADATAINTCTVHRGNTLWVHSYTYKDEDGYTVAHAKTGEPASNTNEYPWFKDFDDAVSYAERYFVEIMTDQRLGE